MESHFYVFVTLPLLAFYRDWTVLAAMSVVVVGDHFVRGIYWPQSLYGAGTTNPLRFLEYSSWILMEDLYLWLLCKQGLRETWSIAQRQADLEAANEDTAAINNQLRDEIVHRQQAQQELERSKNAAEAASRAKTEFLANMSHELRTPLNSVIGFSDVLSEQVFGPLNEEQAQYVTDILESGQHLLSLVNDILDLAKIEAGSMEIELAAVDVARVVERSLQMFRERAIRLGIRLVGHVDEQFGHIQADERRLKQLLYNLLSNALKFTPEGGEVRVEVSNHDDGVVLAVSDTGVGIPAEECEKIFQSFYQVDSTLSKNCARHRSGAGRGPPDRRVAWRHGARREQCRRRQPLCRHVPASGGRGTWRSASPRCPRELAGRFIIAFVIEPSTTTQPRKLRWQTRRLTPPRQPAVAQAMAAWCWWSKTTRRTPA